MVGGQASTNICVRQSVNGEAVADFLRRAEAGEFAQEHRTATRAVIFWVGPPGGDGPALSHVLRPM